MSKFIKVTLSDGKKAPALVNTAFIIGAENKILHLKDRNLYIEESLEQIQNLLSDGESTGNQS